MPTSSLKTYCRVEEIFPGGKCEKKGKNMEYEVTIF